MLDSTKFSMYEGHIDNCKMQGYGVLIDLKANKYQGKFNNDMI